MYNSVFNLKYYKILIFTLFFIISNILFSLNSFSETFKNNASLIINDKYDFVELDLFFAKKYKNSPSKILLGLKVKLKPHWKIYWRNPGDAGLPPEINWGKTNNIKSIDLLFPSPKKFNFYDIETFGYEKEVIFPLDVNVIDQNKIISGILEFDAQVCSDICVPINHKFNLYNLNQKNKNLLKLKEIIDYKSRVPKLIKNEDFRIISSHIQNQKLKLIFDNNINIKPNDIIIEDVNGKVFNKIAFSINDKKLDLTFDINEIKKDLKKKFKITFIEDKLSYEKLVFTPINLKNNIISNHKKIIPLFGFEIIFIAFLGGFILNFMPCVLPVLSLKMIQLVNYRTKNKAEFRKKIFFNILGILTTFILLSIGTYFVKEAGNLVGWGMQFQNPFFLIFMIFITSFFALNLLGMFQFFLPPKILTLLSFKGEGFLGDYTTGMFLTFLATPCTAPFVGTAIGFALSGNTLQIFSILLIMGFGFSFPLILISLFPRMIAFIPKPGNWLITFKKIMAFFLFLTAIWLSNILLNILSNNKSFQNYDQNKMTVNWDIDKDKSLPNDLVKQGKIVFVDVTADWCLTCKVNKTFVLETKKIKELFKKNNVIILRLDWTKPNENIKKFLKDKGRYGIPFNEIYTPKITAGKIFPELLSIDIINEYFEIVE